jgi:hypothetical protein
MAEDAPEQDQLPNIQALVDAAIKEALMDGMSRLEQRNYNKEQERNSKRKDRDKRQEERREERKRERAEKASLPEKKKETANPVEKRSEAGREQQNQNFGNVAKADPPQQRERNLKERGFRSMEWPKSIGGEVPQGGLNPRETLLAYTAAASSSTNHPWKVYRDGTTVIEGSPEVIAKYRIVGGLVYGQDGGAPKEVLDQPVIGAAGSGWVYLKIDRDSSSRVISSATVGHGVSIPDDDYNTQYRALAYVFGVGGGPPLQLQFQEIRIYEMMIVENGELPLHVFDMGARRSYPSPA